MILLCKAAIEVSLFHTDSPAPSLVCPNQYVSIWGLSTACVSFNLLREGFTVLWGFEDE